MKKNSTKRALITSVVALFLCFTMLLGTTYAWFTDSVSSANNIITAGNLDIDLEYAKIVDGQVTDWAPVAGEDELFDPNALWEPGRVEVVYLKVSNLGSLALKYQLGVNVVEEKTATNMAGEEFKLSDHLVFTVVEMPDALTTFATHEEAVAAAGTTKGLKDYNGKTTALEVAGVDYVALIVYMPETVGNEANYRGTAPSITLGVNLYATQQAAEKDSFDENYDKDAWADGMKVYAAEDIVSALANGEAVVLMNDITATEIIEITDDAAIDLNGKTLTANLTIAADAEVVIENGKIVTSSPANSAIETVGNLTLNDVEIESDRHAVRVEGGVTVINDGYYKAAGYAGRTQHAVNVSDGGKVIINGGTFVGPKGTASDSGSAVAVGTGSEVVINGGNFSGGKTKTLSSKGTLTVYGGTFDQDPTAFLADGYTVLDNGDGTFLAYFPQSSVDALLDNAQAGDVIEIPAGTYTFPSAKLKAGVTLNCAPGTVFKGQTSLNIKGATVVGATFSNPSGSVINSNTINGTFKNCTFIGKNALRYGYAGETVVFEDCVITATSVYAIHFDGLTGKNVTFKNCKITGWNAIAGGANSLTFDGCEFYGNGTYGLVRSYSDATIKDCTFDVSKVNTKDVYQDGIHAVDSTITVENCTNVNGETKALFNVSGSGEILYNGAICVASAEKVAAALASDAEEIEIILAQNISMDIGTGKKLGGANTESITIDGNGYTLTLSSTYRSYFNLANAEGTLYLKDMTLTNNHKGTHFFDYTTHFNCDVVADDVTFAKSPLVSDGAIAVFNNCNFSQAGNDIYGLWIMSGTNVTVNGGELTTERGFKIADEDSAKALTTLNVSNTKFNNTKKAAILVTTNYGAEITLNNLDITNCGADNVNEVWIDDGRTATADLIVVTGGNVVIER